MSEEVVGSQREGSQQKTDSDEPKAGSSAFSFVSPEPHISGFDDLNKANLQSTCFGTFGGQSSDTSKPEVESSGFRLFDRSESPYSSESEALGFGHINRAENVGNLQSTSFGAFGGQSSITSPPNQSPFSFFGKEKSNDDNNSSGFGFNFEENNSNVKSPSEDQSFSFF